MTALGALAAAVALVGVAVLAQPPSSVVRLRRADPRGARTSPAVEVSPVTRAVRLVREFPVPRRATAPRQAKHGTPADVSGAALTADLLAACLAAGLPVPTAVRAVAGAAPGEAARALRAAADALALGAPAERAWEPARRCVATTELARAACRTARSGSAMSSAASAVAERLRQNSIDEVEARAQRAGVLIAGPLGLCFLPAFLCLGVIPVVIGLAGRLGVTG